MKQRMIVAALAVAGAGAVAGRQPDALALTIVVGPNVRVSRTSALPRVELQIAANPTDARNLIGAAIVTEQDADRCKAYASFDGGYTWHETTFPELPDTGSGDPQVAFAPDGTAYFTALGTVRGADGRDRFSLILLRSPDGGRSWRQVAVYGTGYAPDHGQMIVDAGAAAPGRLFVSVSHTSTLDEENVGVFRSDNRGESMIGPLHAAQGTGRGLFTLNPVVFSDGSLFVPMLVSDRKPLADRTIPSADIYFTRSSDGGYTFPPMAKIRTQALDPQYTTGSPYASVVFAADRTGGFPDRLYMVWGQAVAGHYHLEGAYSTDKGQSWSEPRDIGNPSSDTNQFRPAVAVNSRGVLGVAWLDTRGTGAPRFYNEYFSASVDGGNTFLPAVKVSSQPSSLDAPGNVVLRPTIDSPRRRAGSITFSFVSTHSGFPDGGDYLGMAADAAGAFHPLWADTRSGSFQAWTATVSVGQGRRDSSQPATPPPTVATDKFAPLFDPASYEPATGIEQIPVRLQNVSDDTVCKPIVAHLKRATAGRTATAPLTGPGDTIDYSGSLGMFSCLAPGEATEPVIWRVRAPNQADTFASFEFTVTAVVQAKR